MIARASEQAEAPATVMAMVRDGEFSVYAYGSTRLGGGESVDGETWFQVASLSKIVTGIIANKLVLEGKLDPNASVLDFLPDNEGERLASRLKEITVRDLLHHRSGLPRDSVAVGRKDNDPMLRGLADAGLMQDLASVEMVGPPGAQYEYSNLGYGLLSYILERASGRSYAELVGELVARPHGLDRLSADRPNLSGAIAVPYAKDAPLRETKEWNTGRLTSASGLYASAHSLAQLMKAQLAAYRAGESENPLYLTRDSRPVEGDRIYGYGLNCQPLAFGGIDRTLCYHSGDMDGFAAIYMFVPEANRGFVMLTSRGGRWKEQLQVELLKWMLSN